MHTPTALVTGPACDQLALAIQALHDAGPAAAPVWKMQALTDVANAYRALGDLTQTESYLQQALRWSHLVGADATVHLLCELADLAVTQGMAAILRDISAAQLAREKARDFAFESAQLACRAADAQWEVQVLLRVSDALDRCGDHGDAIALQCRALHLLFRGEVSGLNAEPRVEAQVMM